MNRRHLMLIAMLAGTPAALAQPQADQPSIAVPPGAAQQAEQAEAPAPSSSVEEFFGRTADVARQQAEAEVQLETRRKVRRVFHRLLRR